MIRSFWPLLIPFSVVLIGSWRLSTESTIPTGGPQQVVSRREKKVFRITHFRLLAISQHASKTHRWMMRYYAKGVDLVFV